MPLQQGVVQEGKSVSPKAALLAATTACIRNLSKEPSIVESRRSSRSSSPTNTTPPPPPPPLDEIVQQYAPKCLEKQFRELYAALQPALASNTHNASAILQGHRGTGKSLLLQQVLAACRPYHTFRVVYVNGITVPGGSIARVVREMLRQLCAEDEVGSSDEEDDNSDDNSDNNDDDDETNGTTIDRSVKRRRTARSKLRRLKQTSFTNQLQFLNELMQIARIDGVPIVFVLDELDTFLGDKNNNKQSTTTTTTDGRQLLLYHLLDRVASDGSLCSCVGLTCHTGFLTRLEKRIQSRAEGTTRFIYTGPPPSYDALVRNVLLADFGANEDDPLSRHVQPAILQHAPWERQYRMGQPVRWFRARLYRAMVLYRYKLQQADDSDDDIPVFDAATLDDGSTTTVTMITDDWTGPEVAMVLAARRLLVRGTTTTTTGTSGLTIQAMIHEYRSSFQRYSPQLLHQTCLHLLERGVLRPAQDHTGTGPFLYQQHDPSMTRDEPELQALPLHLTMDIHRDVKRALDANTLSSCSTALREWGRRTVG